MFCVTNYSLIDVLVSYFTSLFFESIIELLMFVLPDVDHVDLVSNRTEM